MSEDFHRNDPVDSPPFSTELPTGAKRGWVTDREREKAAGSDREKGIIKR